MAKRSKSGTAELFKDYSSYHRTPGNKLTHYLGIPMIVISLLGLLGSLTIGPDSWEITPYLRLDGGILLWAVAMLWYFRMDWRLAIPFAFITLGLNFFARAFPLPVLWGVFVLGWILQFIGHYAFEKKSPAFFKNFEHLMVGPFWICATLLGYKPEK